MPIHRFPLEFFRAIGLRQDGSVVFLSLEIHVRIVSSIFQSVGIEALLQILKITSCSNPDILGHFFHNREYG